MQTFQKPVVASISPDASTVGCRITVTGSNLQFTSATVGGVNAQVEYVSPTSVIVIVPNDAPSGPVVIFNDTGVADVKPLFTVTIEQPTGNTSGKPTEVLHHERVQHQNEQVAREAQPWPNQGLPPTNAPTDAPTDATQPEWNKSKPWKKKK